MYQIKLRAQHTVITIELKQLLSQVYIILLLLLLLF